MCSTIAEAGRAGEATAAAMANVDGDWCDAHEKELTFARKKNDYGNSKPTKKACFSQRKSMLSWRRKAKRSSTGAWPKPRHHCNSCGHGIHTVACQVSCKFFIHGKFVIWFIVSLQLRQEISWYHCSNCHECMFGGFCATAMSHSGLDSIP